MTLLIQEESSANNDSRSVVKDYSMPGVVLYALQVVFNHT